MSTDDTTPTSLTPADAERAMHQAKVDRERATDVPPGDAADHDDAYDAADEAEG